MYLRLGNEQVMCVLVISKHNITVEASDQCIFCAGIPYTY